MESRLTKFFRGDVAWGILLALFVFCVYLATVSPSIGAEDGGEIAAAVGTLGIMHPTGYPLFSLLARIVSVLPVGDLRVIAKLNLMSAFSCAAAAFLLYHLFLTLLVPLFPSAQRPERRAGTARKAEKSAKGGKPLHKAPRAGALETARNPRLAAATGVLVLAFSRVYWTNAVSLEVYALHIVFLALVTLLFVRSLRAHLQGAANADRLWIAFAYALGLSFTNHMMTVLLFPAFLYFYFNAHGFGKAAWLKIVRGVPVFLLALTAYLYIPIRAASRPVMNWNNPENLYEFWRHVTGAQYRYKMFDSFDGAVEKLLAFFRELPSDFGYAPLLPAGIGLWLLLRNDRKTALFSLLIFGTGTFYAVNYSFNDFNFNLNAHVAFAFWVCVGFAAMAQRAQGAFRARLSQAAAVLLVLFPLGLNHARVDRHGNYMVEDYSRNLLASLEPNAILITDQYDHFAAASTYLQFVEGLRPDVITLIEFRMGDGDYDLEMAQRYPGYRTFFPHAAVGKLRVRTFEEFQQRYGNVARDFVSNLGKRPLYITFTSGQAFSNFDSLQSVPYGMVMRLYKDSMPLLAPPPREAYHPLPAHRDSSAVLIQQLRARAYTRQAVYRVMVLADTAAAVDLLRMAVLADPDFGDARINLRILQGY
jgi:hypothetical protein